MGWQCETEKKKKKEEEKGNWRTFNLVLLRVEMFLESEDD